MTEPNLRVTYRDTRSPTVRHYGTRFPLFTPADDSNVEGERHFRATSRVHINTGGHRQLNGSGWQVAHGLFAIDGISYVTMRPLEVNAFRYVAFDWEDLHDDVMRVIESAEPYCTKLPHIPTPSCIRRIRLFRTRSPQVFNYAVGTRLFTPLHDLDSERRFPSTECVAEADYTPLARQALEFIRGIPGITSMTIRPFEVNVFKYDHFTFEEMHERVLDGLRLAFAGDEPVVVERCGVDYP